MAHNLPKDELIAWLDHEADLVNEQAEEELQITWPSGHANAILGIDDEGTVYMDLSQVIANLVEEHGDIEDAWEWFGHNMERSAPYNNIVYLRTPEPQ